MNLAENLAITIDQISRTWTPHEKQLELVAPLLLGQKDFFFLNWGRQTGKSEFICFLAWVWGRLHPGSQSHYFAPQRKMAKEILWSSGRIQGFGPKSWIRGEPNETELRVRWANHPEGLIQLHGADDEDSAVRGLFVKAGILFLDEFRMFREGFWPAAEPITLAYNCPVVIISTPPESFVDPNNPELPNWYVRLAERAKTSPRGVYSVATSLDNPHLQREKMLGIRDELYSFGQGNIWEREYEAKWVSGGASSLFPMLKRDYHVREAGWVRHELLHMLRYSELVCVFDPGSRAAFAVLLVAITPDGTMYCLEEIYERDQASNTATQIWDRARELMLKWTPSVEAWTLIYDEAALWFASEINATHLNSALSPTQKSLYKREPGEPKPGISQIKRAMLGDKFFISTDCPFLFWEMENYGLDENGKISRHAHDHLIDCLFYATNESHYVPGERRDIVVRDSLYEGNSVEKINQAFNSFAELDYFE